jgi:hypothetical protein
MKRTKAAKLPASKTRFGGWEAERDGVLHSTTLPQLGKHYIIIIIIIIIIIQGKASQV